MSLVYPANLQKNIRKTQMLDTERRHREKDNLFKET